MNYCLMVPSGAMIIIIRHITAVIIKATILMAVLLSVMASLYGKATVIASCDASGTAGIIAARTGEGGDGRAS